MNAVIVKHLAHISYVLFFFPVFDFDYQYDSIISVKYADSTGKISIQICKVSVYCIPVPSIINFLYFYYRYLTNFLSN